MPLNINIQQILLHLFNFALLFTILYFLLYKPVKDFMDKRSAAVEKIREDAKASLSEAESIKADYASRLDHIEDEIKERRAAADRDTAEAVSKKLENADKEAKHILEEAKQDAKAERSRLLKETQNEIADMANAMAEQVVTKSTHDAFEQFLTSAERGNPDA